MTGGCVPVSRGMAWIEYRHKHKTIDTKQYKAVVCPQKHTAAFLHQTEANMKEIKRGEVYYADLSPVRGSEQGGVRPVLILQNDTGNKHSPTTLVAAITSRKTKAALPTHVPFTADFMKAESIVLLEQIRTIDKTRLDGYIGKIDKKTMGAVDKAIVVSFGIKYLEVLLK